MTKVFLQCVSCDFKAQWYEHAWFEIMAAKAGQNYLCFNCESDLSRKAIEKLFKDKNFGKVIFSEGISK